jgi:hypothetical protein
MGAISFTPEQFEALMAKLNQQPGQAEVVRTSVLSGPVGWSDLPVLETGEPAGIDQWLVMFEVKLKASRVDPSRWAERFEECPRVPQEVKSRLPQEALSDYAATRKWVLKEYGPLDPVGFFRSKLYEVKGEGRKKVRKELQDLLVLYNRAASDCNGPKFTQRDLIYPFIKAFPDDGCRVLTKDLGFALAQDDPFEQLFHRAPESVPEASSSNLTLLSQVQELPSPKRIRVPDSTEEKLDYLMTQVAALREGRFEQQRAVCAGCGGTCLERRSCPAQGRVCNNCQALHHFATVCRRPRMQARVSSTDRNRPFRLSPANQQPP